MKVNKRRIIVSSLSILMGASLVGSIAGTVAWYQYSTRATASYNGASASMGRFLQVQGADDNWYTDLSTSQVNALIGKGHGTVTDDSTSLYPITTGNMEKDAALTSFYDAPQYQYFTYDKWKTVTADEGRYVQFTLKLRTVLNDKEDTQSGTPFSTDVYLTDVTIAAQNGQAKDISPALRVQVSSAGDTEAFNAMFSKAGESINTHGTLDLNGDGSPDTSARYDWEKTENLTATEYGTGTQTSYIYNDAEVVADDTNGALAEGQVTAKSLGKTSTTDGLDVVVTIWLEGWQQLDSSATWKSEDYLGAKFQVGLSFGCTYNGDTSHQ